MDYEKSCTGCGITLTDEEAHYYSDRCGDCEKLWSRAMDIYRGRFDAANEKQEGKHD